MTKTLRTTIISLIYVLSLVFFFLGLYKLFAIFLVLISAIGVKKNFCSVKFVILCLIISALSVFYVESKKPVPDYLSTIAPIDAKVEGKIISFPEFKANHSVKFEMLVNSVLIDDKTIQKKSKTLVKAYRFYDREKIKIGDNVTFDANIKIPFGATNPGEFDYKKYLENKHIFTVSTVQKSSDIKVEPPKELKWKLLQKINDVKIQIIKEHSKHLQTPYLELLGGMVFGDDAVTPPEKLKDNFLKSGLLHLLAASGMNVGFVFIAWFTLSQLFRVPYRPAIIIGGILVLLYSCMTGFPPSITRAALMIELVLIGKLFNRQADNFAILSFVCAILLLYDPYMLYNVGFQLSFIVTLGLLFGIWILEKLTTHANSFVPEEFEEKFKFNILGKVINLSPQALISGFLAILLIPIIAQIWATPIQAYHFNSFSPYSVLANIIVVPFVEIVSFIGFTGSILGLIPFVGAKICAISDFVLKPLVVFICSTADFFAHRHDSIIYCKQPEIALVVSFYACVVLVCFAIKYDFKKKIVNILAVFFAVICIAIPFYSYYAVQDAKIVVFDAGKDDATLIVTPHRHVILVNTGNGGRFSTAKSAIVPYLRDLGINKVDAIVFSDYSKVNLASIKEISENTKVRSVFVPLSDEKSSLNLIEKLEKNVKSQIIRTKTNKILFGDGSEFEIVQNVSGNLEVFFYYKKYSLKIGENAPKEPKVDGFKSIKDASIKIKDRLYHPQTSGAIMILTDGYKHKTTEFLKK